MAREVLYWCLCGTNYFVKKKFSCQIGNRCKFVKKLPTIIPLHRSPNGFHPPHLERYKSNSMYYLVHIWRVLLKYSRIEKKNMSFGSSIIGLFFYIIRYVFFICKQFTTPFPKKGSIIFFASEYRLAMTSFSILWTTTQVKNECQLVYWISMEWKDCIQYQC